MALTKTEGTKQTTMDIINARLGFPPDTIKYARIFSQYKTRDNHPGGAFTAMLDCFLQDAPGADQDTSLHYEFGCNLPDTELAKMAATDDRDILYKHLEYIINLQDARRRQEESPDTFDPVAEEAALKALETELGITSMFHVVEPVVATAE